MSSTRSVHHRRPSSSSSVPSNSLLKSIKEPPHNIFPSMDEFLRLVAVLAIASSVAVCCNIFFTLINRQPKPFCDSHNSHSPDSISDFCEPCPSNGECNQGKLECVRGYRKHGKLCVEDGDINETAKKIVCPKKLIHSGTFMCPKKIDTVPEKFLQGFEALKVLDLRQTSIRSLPHSLLQLRDLRVLDLYNCKNLEELPSLGTLTKLRDLYLRGTCIANLPRGIENLSELRVLNLDETRKLKSIQPGIISKLSCLESLSMWESGFCFRLKGEEDGQATFEELKLSFNRLHYLDISLNGSAQITFDEKRCSIWNLNLSLSQEWIGWFWDNSSSMQLYECTGLVEMLEDFIESDASFAGLKSLSIRNCPTSLGRGGGCAARCDLLPNLEELHLESTENLNSISELAGDLGQRFHSLRSIKVEYCRQMKYLLSCGDFIQTLPNLEVIKVNDCVNLEKLFNNESGQNISPDPMVPKLRILQLGNLPKFKTLSRHEETWPCLEQVRVWGCKGLRRLPLTNQNAGTIKEIKGESEWWDALEWDDDQTKTSLLPFLHPQ